MGRVTWLAGAVTALTLLAGVPAVAQQAPHHRHPTVPALPEQKPVQRQAQAQPQAQPQAPAQPQISAPGADAPVAGASSSSAVPDAGAGAQAAPPAPRVFQNPPELQPSPPRQLPGQALRALKTASAAAPAAEVTFDLDVNYTDSEIFNPSTGLNDKVHLRSYNGSLVAPTVNVYPAQTVRMRLHNKLPVENEGDCPPPKARNHTVPSCLNTTNLHFQGLHVSPTGNSDNVLLEIAPGQNFDYEVNIPADHPAGTFWYHSHRHGSTALQVSSGMEGALIVRGQRTLAQRNQNGGVADIDTILKKPGGAALDENLLLFQQIAYACFTGPNSATVQTQNAGDGTSVWSCPPGVAGQVQYYGTQFGPPSWPASGRYTMITGQVQPTFGEAAPGQGKAIHAGDIQRWRLIHAGVRDTISLQIVKATGLDAGGGALPPNGTAQQANWVSQHCNSGQAVGQWEFAVDGLTRLHPVMKQTNILQPAYRSDVLVAFPSSGVYCLVDQAAPATTIINPRPEGKDRRLLGLVLVQDGTPIQGDPETYILQRIQAANADMPADVAQQLQGKDLTAFAPNAPLAADQVVGKRDVAFNLALTTGNPPRFEINDAIYSPARVDFRPVINTVEDWNVTSKLAAHVFHIHVNPFEIVDILDPGGKTIFAPGGCTELNLKAPNGSPAPDPQYCDLKGLFRDTVFIKGNYHLILRTAYTRYIGEFVLHCHILDHEDQGMMLNVEVMPEGGNEAIEAAAGSAGHAH